MIIYKGFEIRKDAVGALFRILVPGRGGFLSPQLQGKYTSLAESKKAIDNYKPVRPRETTPTVKAALQELPEAVEEVAPKVTRRRKKSAE